MSKRSLVIVLVAVLAIGAFGAWEAYAQGPGGDNAPCGDFYGHGMMRGGMMGGWNASEDCPFADGTWSGLGMMGGRTGRGPMHGRGGMMGGWNMSEDFPFAADGVELILTEDEARAAAQTYLDENYSGLTLDETVATFNGYYMLHILEDGQLVGMLSVNGETGEVWLHHRPWSTGTQGS